MEENNLITNEGTQFITECPTCGVGIVEVEKLEEGHENDTYTCPKCNTPLGVGFRVIKIQENIPV